jgi:hypothetical protein
MVYREVELQLRSFLTSTLDGSVFSFITLSLKDKIRNNIIKQKLNVTRYLLEDIKTISEKKTK